MKLTSPSSSAEVKNEWICISSPPYVVRARRQLDLSTYASSYNAYPTSFRHLGPNALLFSEGLTMICRPEVQVFSHENRHVLGRGDGGEGQLFVISSRFNPAENLIRRYAVGLKNAGYTSILAKTKFCAVLSPQVTLSRSKLFAPTRDNTSVGPGKLYHDFATMHCPDRHYKTGTNGRP